jgi:hypothetical protein
MDREALDRLSREELLELLSQQAEVIGRQQGGGRQKEAQHEPRQGLYGPARRTPRT